MAGAGFASGLHLAGWKRLDNAEVVAICDPNEEKAAARAREFGVAEVFNDAEEMLNAVKPDAIDIVAPMAAHVPCATLPPTGASTSCAKSRLRLPLPRPRACRALFTARCV